MVRVPATSLTLSPLKLNLSATNLAVPCSSVLKKSLLRRCLLKGSTPVLIDVVSMVSSTLPTLAARSSCTVPSFLSKRPRLVDVPM